MLLIFVCSPFNPQHGETHPPLGIFKKIPLDCLCRHFHHLQIGIVLSFPLQCTCLLFFCQDSICKFYNCVWECVGLFEKSLAATLVFKWMHLQPILESIEIVKPTVLKHLNLVKYSKTSETIYLINFILEKYLLKKGKH